MLRDTPVCDFGWAAPAFELPDAHATLHSLQEHLSPKGLLIAMRQIATTGHGPQDQTPSMGCSIKWR